MRIAVDGMGGDYAPEEIVKGTVIATKEYGVQISLVGPSDLMGQELAKHDLAGTDIEIVHAGEYLSFKIVENQAGDPLKQNEQIITALGNPMVVSISHYHLGFVELTKKIKLQGRAGVGQKNELGIAKRFRDSRRGLGQNIKL